MWERCPRAGGLLRMRHRRPTWGRGHGAGGWFIGFIGVAARGYSLHAELGYGFDLGDHVVLVPRVRLRGPNISVNKFTDAVNARVSFEDIGRLIGGLGLTVHSTLPVDGGEIWLRGALDLWMAAIAGTASRSASV